LYRIFKINCGLITWKECKQQAEKIIISTIKSGVKIISIIDKDFPKNIQNTKFKQKCILLYYKGDISIANSKCVAIIGARKPPACIESKVLAWTSSIAYQLAIKKYTVVSGLAIGCDTAGHIGCLNADGKTIAFLPGNLNSIYPKVNQELANRIVKNGGCLISEKGIYDKISKNGFIDRDRLQAMISDFIIVGYADNKCSTMFAVNNALKNSLPIYQSKFSKIKLNGQIKIWNMNL
jgi:DNA processing protein